MTEYDYSPEGYERYLETQQRISQWVDTAEAHRHQFRAPFDSRSDVDERERWDGVFRKGHGRDDLRHPRRVYYPSPLVPPPPPPPMVAHPNQTWHQTPAMEPPALVITTSSKRKSAKSSKSHRSHKSSSKSRQQTYIIQPPLPPVPTMTVPQPPLGQYASPNSNSVIYMTTDHTGYPVTRTSRLHPIPGSRYSYSTPPPMAGPPPVSNPPPMISPYTTPAGSPLLPPGSSFHQHQANVVIMPPNTRKLRVIY